MPSFLNLFRPGPVASMLKQLDALDQSDFAKSSQWKTLIRKAVLRILLDQTEICFEVDVNEVQVMDLLLNLLGNTCFDGLINMDPRLSSEKRLADLQEGVRLYRNILARSVAYGFTTQHDATDSIRMLLEASEH